MSMAIRGFIVGALISVVVLSLFWNRPKVVYAVFGTLILFATIKALSGG